MCASAEQALLETGVRDQVHLRVHAARVLVALDELATVAPQVDWSGRLASELTAALRTVGMLNEELREHELTSLADGMAGPLVKLRDTTPAAAWARDARGKAPRSLAASDDADLARQAIATAAQAVSKLGRGRMNNDRQHAIALCTPMPSRLALATDSALQITDRRQRMALRPDVERLSKQLDDLASFLTMEPRMQWDITFAATFDAENRLRGTLGMTPRARPYSGTMDPAEAIRAVMGMSQEARVKALSQPYADPQTAAKGVVVAVNSVFESKISAVEDLKDLLAEPWPAAVPSFFKSVLQAVVVAAIETAAGRVMTRFSSYLENLVARKHLARSVGSGLLTLSREQMLATSKALGGNLGQSVVKHGTGAVSKVSKALFGEAVKKAKKLEPGVGAAEPRNAFFHHHLVVLKAEKVLAELELVHLMRVLQQVDLEDLNALTQHLVSTISSTAYEAQRISSLREWHNYKALLAAGPVNREKPSLGARVGEDRKTDGVIEVRAKLHPDPAATDLKVQSVVLRGAERYSLETFKQMAVPLRSLGLHQRLDIRIGRSFDWLPIVIGIAPNGALQDSSLSTNERRLLKAYGTGQMLDGGTVVRALEGHFDHHSDDDARRVAQRLAQRLVLVNSRLLERGS